MLVNKTVPVDKSMMKKIMDYVQKAGMERRCDPDNKCYLFYHNKRVVLNPEYIIIGSVKVKTPEEAVRYIYG